MTAGVVFTASDPPLTWVDVIDPSREELAEIARKYGLHATSVQDCLDPEHLPKYERIQAVTFVIVRAIDEDAKHGAATVQGTTRKIAIFGGPDFLVTIHRKDLGFLARLREEYAARAAQPNGDRRAVLPRLVADVINGAIDSYGKPLEAAEAVLDSFEGRIFGDTDVGKVVRDLYRVKRRVTLFKRMLLHTADVVQRLVPASEPTAPLYQDLRENAQSMHFYADELLEEANNLISIQLALGSHRTGEIVRVLTIFSAFFLPLTFIVGIYGMNFDFMPELDQRWGYPATLLGLGLVALAIYLWFRRRGWLGRRRLR